MSKEISDLDLILVWSRTKEHLKVYVNNGGLLKIDILLFNSVTGFVHPLLSDRQVKWILEDYERKRMIYT
jgi:hypothetical protein